MEDKKLLEDKINNASPLELTVINFQLLLGRIDDAIKAKAKSEACTQALKKAQDCLAMLYENLNMDVEISHDFAKLYLLVNSILIQAEFKRTNDEKNEELTHAHKIISELMSAWQAVLDDPSLVEKSLAGGGQSFVGLTYGADGKLNEYDDYDPKGGYEI